LTRNVEREALYFGDFASRLHARIESLGAQLERGGAGAGEVALVTEIAVLAQEVCDQGVLQVEALRQTILALEDADRTRARFFDTTLAKQRDRLKFALGGGLQLAFSMRNPQSGDYTPMALVMSAGQVVAQAVAGLDPIATAEGLLDELADRAGRARIEQPGMIDRARHFLGGKHGRR